MDKNELKNIFFKIKKSAIIQIALFFGIYWIRKIT